MEVSVITAMGIAHGRNLLATRDALAAAHQHGVEVPVKCVDVFDVPAVAVGVADDDYVAPSQMNVAGKDHDPVTNAVNRVPQVGVPAPGAIPVFPKVSVRAKAARFI